MKQPLSQENLNKKVKYYGRCKECKQMNTAIQWCHSCNSKRFQRNFDNWNSGNADIDKFIRNVQLNAKTSYKLLEWIPYHKFYDIEYIAKGGFGTVYRAKWRDGYIHSWNAMNHQWRRFQPSYVALKCLNNSQNVTFDFINEITMHNYLIEEDNIQIVRCYGITQDPSSKNYVIVMNCAEYRSLRNYLSIHLDYEKFWSNKIQHLKEIAMGLEIIHEKNFIHRDLHIGNVVKFITYTAITDMGLCKPADYKENKGTNHSVYGVLPYTAPEILRGQHYTQSSDIYSFGMIMYEVVSGFPPYYDKAHDESLALNICQGLRPRFNNIKVPPLILHLNKRCLDANPLNRPKASEIREILTQWERHSKDNRTEFFQQLKEAEDFNKKFSIGSIQSIGSAFTYETHPKAIYTSRLLQFNSLPEPRNADDYYEHYDNLSSMEYLESVQLDPSQLNINDFKHT